MKKFKLVKISLYFGNNTKPSAYMMIPVPPDRDKEEYIDEFLDNMLNVDLRYNTEWNYKWKEAK